MKRLFRKLLGRSKSTKSTTIEPSQHSRSPCNRLELGRYSVSGISPRRSSSSSPVIDFSMLGSRNIPYSTSSSREILQGGNLPEIQVEEENGDEEKSKCTLYTDATFHKNFWILSSVVRDPKTDDILGAKVVRVKGKNEDTQNMDDPYINGSYEAELAGVIEGLRFFDDEVRHNIVDYGDELEFIGDNKDVMTQSGYCVRKEKEDSWFSTNRRRVRQLELRRMIEDKKLEATFAHVGRNQNEFADAFGKWARKQVVEYGNDHVLRSYTTNEDIKTMSD